ncbi:MAG: hypothetical protein ABL908_22445, partial [Hyphomicrobium sp.]
MAPAAAATAPAAPPCAEEQLFSTPCHGRFRSTAAPALRSAHRYANESDAIPRRTAVTFSRQLPAAFIMARILAREALVRDMAAGYDTVQNFTPEMAVARVATGARALFRRALPVAAAFALGACAGGALDTGSLALPSVTLPKLDLPKVDISKIELPKVELPEAALPVVGTPTEVYTRVA